MWRKPWRAPEGGQAGDYSGVVMRLFIAIALTGEAAAAVDRLVENLARHSADLRWSRPEDRHVTLQFLGKAAPEQAACVSEALAAVRSPQFPVRIADLGFFMRAGVFWAGVEAGAQLIALQRQVTEATRRCGFREEERPYRPHITLARRRGRSGGEALSVLEKSVERGKIRVAEEFLTREFALYESFPEQEGSRYEVRARFSLG